MIFAPLEARRHVHVCDQWARVDFVVCIIKELVDFHYLEADQIVLVIDYLNTHSIGTLYEVFEPAEVKRLTYKLEIDHTPKHESWLNMAEIEIGILSRQALSDYVATKEEMMIRVAELGKPIVMTRVPPSTGILQRRTLGSGSKDYTL